MKQRHSTANRSSISTAGRIVQVFKQTLGGNKLKLDTPSPVAHWQPHSDLLGMRVMPTDLFPSVTRGSRQDEKVVRLYQQGIDHKRIGGYLARWLGWAMVTSCVAALADAPDFKYSGGGANTGGPYLNFCSNPEQECSDEGYVYYGTGLDGVGATIAISNGIVGDLKFTSDWLSRIGPISYVLVRTQSENYYVAIGLTDYVAGEGTWRDTFKLSAPTEWHECYVTDSFSTASGCNKVSSCSINTDYGNGRCRGTFKATTKEDLVDYVAGDFGKNSGSHFKNLSIMGDLTADQLDIESPCKISVAKNVQLDADFVSLDGRKGVAGNLGMTINAQTACVLSEQGDAGIGNQSMVTVDNMTIQAAKAAKIGNASTVDVSDTLTLLSTGDKVSSIASILPKTTVDAGILELTAGHSATLGGKTNITAKTITLTSISDHRQSSAGVNTKTVVSAEDLTITSQGNAHVGNDTTLNIENNLGIHASRRQAIVQQRTQITVGGDMALTSDNQATILQNSNLDVTGDFEMDAAFLNKCTVKASATVLFESASGNCEPKLP